MPFKIEKTKLSDFKVREYVENVPASYKHVHLTLNGANYMVRSIYPNQNIRGWVNDYDKCVYGLHVQKIGVKTKQKKVLENGKWVTKSTIVRKPKWIYTVYKFPVARVKYFQQYNQHFDVVLF